MFFVLLGYVAFSVLFQVLAAFSSTFGLSANTLGDIGSRAFPLFTPLLLASIFTGSYLSVGVMAAFGFVISATALALLAYCCILLVNVAAVHRRKKRSHSGDAEDFIITPLPVTEGAP